MMLKIAYRANQKLNALVYSKLSFDKGYAGYVSFESKTKLKEHYQKSLGAHILFGNVMAIDTKAAHKLVNQYFPENS